MENVIEIKSIYGELIFSTICENNSIRFTVMRAIQEGISLAYADLSNSDLSGVALCDIDLTGANLQGADLSVSYLCGVKLSSANLRGANLQGANLRDAKLDRSNLVETDLRGTNLRNVFLLGANLYGADLRNADLYLVNLLDVNLMNANLYGTNICSFFTLSHYEPVATIIDWVSISHIGSNNASVLFLKTDRGIFVRCEYFYGTLKNFIKEVKKLHQGNKHEQDYLALVEFVKSKFNLNYRYKESNDKS